MEYGHSNATICSNQHYKKYRCAVATIRYWLTSRGIWDCASFTDTVAETYHTHHCSYCAGMLLFSSNCRGHEQPFKIHSSCVTPNNKDTKLTCINNLTLFPLETCHQLHVAHRPLQLKHTSMIVHVQHIYLVPCIIESCCMAKSNKPC